MNSTAEQRDLLATDHRTGRRPTKVPGAALLALVAMLAAPAVMSGCKKSSSPTDGGAKDVAGDRSGTDGMVVSCDKVAAASKPTSDACSCDKECGSGHCVDSVCCDTVCDGKCMACNLPSSLGLCSNVPAGAKPTDPAECKMDDPSTCLQDGTCDGNGGCRPWVKETTCQSGTCDGDGVSAGRVCDGKGSCIPGHAGACFPYTCDPTTNKCEASCTTHCAGGQQCVNNSCGQKLNGATCQTSDECSTGFCVDHVCCNVACSGACQACDQTGSVGRCQLIPPGLPDPDFCKAEDKNSCGTTGLCDEIGSCAQFPANITACGEASCISDTLLSSARSCDGNGTCRDAQPIDCSPFKCAAGACNKTCTSDTDCASGHPCVAVAGSSAKQCSGLKMNGLTCAAAAECASASCVDGVCCESSCGGACRSCALPGSLGRCMPVAVSAKDPRSMCSDMGQSSCGTNGKCDGTGSCQKYAVGVQCGDEACSGGQYTPAPTCNNQSQCVSSPARTCAPFVCGDARCLSVCSTDLDCVTGQVCVNGSCGLKPNGADCGKAGECQSSHCAQGVCCNAACTGACVACDQTGSMGICTAVKDGSADPQAICQITAQTSCGTTGKCQAGACAVWPTGAKCKDSSCSSVNSVTPASTCNGSGACKTPNDLTCDKFMCTAGACKASCTTATAATDCVPPNSCVGASCGLKADGQTCTAASECTHGFCTEGVCCNSACSDAAGTTGLCRSCKVTGAVGTCTAVASGSADPKNRCTASAPAAGNCSNDGTCNGAGACRPWSSSTGCRMQSCPVGSTTLTASANCDGAGMCAPAQTSTCGNYVCSATSPSCLTTCTKDTDCMTGLTCKVDNKCGTTLSNGQACAANGDCTSNICSGEGVCCDATCTDGCKSCLVAGKVGMCSGTPAGSIPRVTTPPACPPGAPCGNTGKCNGTGACALADAATSCNVTMTCAGAMMSGPAGTCSGTGSCTPTAVACTPGYLCDSSMCATSCTPATAPTVCATGYVCIDGHCKLPAGAGSNCTAPSDCVSGICISNRSMNICCSSPCTDVSCGTTAFCAMNGIGCQPHVASDACTVPPSCSGDLRSSIGTAGMCSPTGTCTPPTATTPCPPGYLCSVGTGMCAATCTDNTTCDTGYSCDGVHCLPVTGGGGMGGSDSGSTGTAGQPGM